MKNKNKNKLIRDVDDDTWRSFKVLMALKDVKASQLFKTIVESFIKKEKSENKKGA